MGSVSMWPSLAHCFPAQFHDHIWEKKKFKKVLLHCTAIESNFPNFFSFEEVKGRGKFQSESKSEHQHGVFKSFSMGMSLGFRIENNTIPQRRSNCLPSVRKNSFGANEGFF